jgi:FtsZ-interacting cell division protein YlmF
MRFPVQVKPGAVRVLTPRAFEEEQVIADQLMAGNVIIVDFKYLDLNIKQRMISFLEGTLFGIDGRMVVLREDVVVLLPHDALFEEPTPEYGPQQVNFARKAFEQYSS